MNVKVQYIFNMYAYVWQDTVNLHLFCHMFSQIKNFKEIVKF